MIFFLALTVRGRFHRILSEKKKYGGTGLLSEKTEVLYTELNERAQTATSSYSAASEFIP